MEEVSPVSEASVLGTNLGAILAGRLVLTSEGDVTESCIEAEEDTERELAGVLRIAFAGIVEFE